MKKINKELGIHIGGAGHSIREYRDVVELTLAPLIPISYDADYSKVPVQMQAKLGICVAEATCSLIERFRNDGVVLSRRFMYVGMKRFVDGNLVEGSTMKSGLHFAYKYGTQPESLCPTDTSMSYNDFVNFDITPFLDTATKIPGYTNIPTDITSLASGIQKYGGLSCRYDCGDSWYSDTQGNITWDPSRILPLKQPKVVVSGHAVVVTGYDFTINKRGNLRNSWSETWALKGDGYSFLTDYGPTEAWAILPKTPEIIDDTTLPFIKNLRYGMRNKEVNRLQRVLKKMGYFVYSGPPTDYYGKATQEAVLRFQLAKGVVRFGIESLFGHYFGAKSRQAMNLIIKQK